MESINWFRIIGNAGTAGISTVISTFTANGFGVAKIPQREVVYLALFMGTLYALLALFHEMQRIGATHDISRKKIGKGLTSLSKPIEEFNVCFPTKVSNYLPF